MATIEVTTKRVAITKANAQMFIAVCLATFITVFCLVAANAVWGGIKFNNKVIDASNVTNKKLKSDISAYQNLEQSFDNFQSTPTNIIGGNPNGTGPNDGTNGQIVIDALPSTYDFPELVTSINNLMTSNSINLKSLSGTDEQLSEQLNNSSSNPTPVSMPFSLGINSINYTTLQQITSVLLRSIRPISIDNMTISGAQNSMSLTLNAHTYYQPGKTVSITKETIQ